MGQRWKSMIASVLLACPAGAVNGGGYVRYNDWEVRNEQGCTAATQIIDAENYSAYVFGFSPDGLAVTSRAGPISSASLQVDDGAKIQLKCLQTICLVPAHEREFFVGELRRGKVAKLELTSLDKTRLYPVPLGNLSVALKAFCPPGPAHVDRRYLNPEPQVAPDPKFNR